MNKRKFKRKQAWPTPLLAAAALIGTFSSSACRGVMGDLNCDNMVSSADIPGLVLALIDPDTYAAQYPNCDAMNADLNADGSTDGLDLNGFVSALTTSAGCNCPSNAFLDVSQAPGPGGSYPQPTLTVSCSDSVMSVRSNGIPHYRFIAVTPGALTAQNYNWQIPLCPQPASQTSTIPLLGPVAIAVNGLPIFGANEAANPQGGGYGDPIYNGLMDPAWGHVAPGPGQYHYHGLKQKVLVPSGLVYEPWNNPEPDPTAVSPIIGFSFDGFPIYGPYCCADEACSRVIEMQSSWVRVGDPRNYAWTAYQYQEQAGEQYLDRCNGHTGSKGVYHYHATNTFPYTLGCYRGTARSQGGGPP